MKRNSLIRHLADGLGFLRRNGFMTMFDPLGVIRKYSQVVSYENARSSIESLNYSSKHILRNTELMTRFRNMKTLQIRTINWFVPYFDHPYGGIHTILRFADYFCARKGVKNRFVIYGKPAASERNMIEKIEKAFPKLQVDKMIILKDNNLAPVPEADICIATLWTSAYLVLKFNRTKGKFYFIQDYEPLSYPAGTLYGLAEATYRFGFCGIINTPGLYESFVRDYGGNAQYFVPPVDTSVFYPSKRAFLKASAEKPFTIFFYARPDRQHNAFELGVRALQEIKRKYGQQVKIFTAGTAWSPQSYDIKETLIDLGTLPYGKTASLYRKCDLGVVFSFSKHPSYVPFELMACGCPVLANYNVATQWLLKDGYNCSVTNPSLSCVCEKVETLMNNPDLRRKLVSNALDSMPRITWDNEIEKIYKFVCNPHSN